MTSDITGLADLERTYSMIIKNGEMYKNTLRALPRSNK